MNASTLQRAYDLVNEVERRLQPLAVREALARWREATDGGEGARRELTEARARLRRFLSQRELFEEVAALRGQVDRRDDEYVKRQLDMLYALMLPFRQEEEWLARQEELEACLDEIYRQLDGEAGDAGPPDAIGREAAPLLLRLIEARNAGARSAGFPDYYSLALTASELREEVVFSLLDALEAGLGTMRGETGGSHDPVLAGRDPVALVAGYFDAIGLRVDKVIAQSVLSPRPGEDREAFCLDVDASGDVRVYCHAAPTERGVRALLHHLGRAVYHLNIAKEFPYLLRRPAHDFTAEAAGLLFEAMLYDEHWHEEWGGASDQEDGERLRAAKARKSAQDASLLRWRLASVHLERALYREPVADWDGLWRRLLERFLGKPQAEKASHWAADAGFVRAPATGPSRVLAMVAAAQLHRMVEEELGEGAMAASPAAGYLLIDRWFAHGARFPWEELVRLAFGRPLDAGVLARDYSD